MKISVTATLSGQGSQVSELPRAQCPAAGRVVAIPLVTGVLPRQGILLSPAVGALLMSHSTVFVAVNAQLLRRSAI